MCPIRRKHRPHTREPGHIFLGLKTVLVNEFTKSTTQPYARFLSFPYSLLRSCQPSDNSGKLKLVGTFHPESDPMTTTTTPSLVSDISKETNQWHMYQALCYMHSIEPQGLTNLRLKWHFPPPQFSVQRSRDCSLPMGDPRAQYNIISSLFPGSTPLKENDLMFKNVFQPFKKEFLQLGVISQTIRGVDLCVAHCGCHGFTCWPH